MMHCIKRVLMAALYLEHRDVAIACTHNKGSFRTHARASLLTVSSDRGTSRDQAMRQILELPVLWINTVDLIAIVYLCRAINLNTVS
jgi:hypothetical protein